MTGRGSLKTRILTWIRREAENQQFAWRPTFILLLAPLFMLWSHYNGVRWVVPGTGWVFTEYFISRFILPLGVILVLFRENPARFGLGPGRIRLGLGLTGIFLLAYIPCFVILMFDDAFVQFYQYTPKVLERITLLDVARGELTHLPTMIGVEFFFRGFILFGLRKSFGDHGANMVHLFPYALGHMDRSPMECFGSLLVGYALGYLALKTGSVWYGVFLHWFLGAGFKIALYLTASLGS